MKLSSSLQILKGDIGHTQSWLLTNQEAEVVFDSR